MNRSVLHGLKTEILLRCDFRKRSRKAYKTVDGGIIMQIILAFTDSKMMQTM